MEAKAAYDALRRRGMSKQEAETEIEIAFEGAFHELLLVGIDRRLEIWISLEEGRRAQDLFADINVVMDSKLGENEDLIQRMRREKHGFVCRSALTGIFPDLPERHGNN